MLETLPIELIFQIIAYAIAHDAAGKLAAQRDLLSFSLVPPLASAARYYLYLTIHVIWCPRTLQSLLSTLARHPALAVGTKSLSIYFDWNHAAFEPAETCQQLFGFLGLFISLQSLVIEGTSSHMQHLSTTQLTQLCHAHKSEYPRSLSLLKTVTLNSSIAPVLPLLLHLGITTLDSVTLEGSFGEDCLKGAWYTSLQTRQLTLAASYGQPNPDIRYWAVFSPECLELTNSFLTFGMWMRMTQTRLCEAFRNLRKLEIVMDQHLYVNVARQWTFLKSSTLEHVVIREKEYQVYEHDSSELGNLILDVLPSTLLRFTIESLGEEYKQNWIYKDGLKHRGFTVYKMVLVQTRHPHFPWPWHKESITTIENWCKPQSATI